MYMCLWMCNYVNVYVYVHVYIYVHVFVHLYVYVWVCVRACVNISLLCIYDNTVHYVRRSELCRSMATTRTVLLHILRHLV